MKKYLGLALVSLVSALSISLIQVNIAHAATDQVSMNLNWDGNCSDAPTISSSPSYLYYWSGDTVSLSAVNQSSQLLDISINQSGGPLAANGGSQTFTRTLSDTMSITVNPDYTTSCAYKSTPATTYIYGASAISTLTCSISNNQVWNLSADYNGVAPSDYLYRGSTYVADFQTTKGGVGSGDFNASFQFSAQTSAQTYYLYDGTSSNDLLLGQTTCPPAAVSSTQNSVSNNTTPIHSATTPTPSSTSITPLTPTTPQLYVKLNELKIGNSAANLKSSITVNTGQSLTLSGQTIPGGIVTLSIHSKLKVVTLTAGKNGQWSDIISGLAPGHHTVQASVKNPANNQASPTIQLLAFTIKPTSTIKLSTILYYVLIPIIILIIAAAALIFTRHKKKNVPGEILPKSEILQVSEQHTAEDNHQL